MLSALKNGINITALLQKITFSLSITMISKLLVQLCQFLNKSRKYFISFRFGSCSVIWDPASKTPS